MKTLLLLALCTFSTICYSQSLQRNSIALTGGYAENGIGTNLSFNVMLDDYNYIQGSILTSFGNYKDETYKIPYNLFTLNIGYFKNIYTNKPRTVLSAIGAGIVGGYEEVNKGDNQLYTGAKLISKSGFIYGAFLSSETEVILSDKLSALLKINEFYHVNSSVGNFTLYGGAGIIFYIN